MNRAEAQAALAAALSGARFAGARGADAEDAASIGVLAVLELRAKGGTVRNAPAVARVAARRAVARDGARVALARASEPVLSAAWDAGVEPACVGGPRGAACHASKLTASKVRTMRRRYATGRVTQQALAERYGVTAACVSYVVRGKSWAAVS